jgi:hypothetical protein
VGRATVLVSTSFSQKVRNYFIGALLAFGSSELCSLFPRGDTLFVSNLISTFLLCDATMQSTILATTLKTRLMALGTRVVQIACKTLHLHTMKVSSRRRVKRGSESIKNNSAKGLWRVASQKNKMWFSHEKVGGGRLQLSIVRAVVIFFFSRGGSYASIAKQKGRREMGGAR